MLFQTDFPADRVRIEGALELERTGRGLRPRRLPAWTRPQINDPFFELAVQGAANVRLVLRTEATELELVLHATRVGLPGGPVPAVVDLVVDGERLRRVPVLGGDILQIVSLAGDTQLIPGSAETIRFAELPAGDKRVEIWLSQSATSDLVSLGGNAELRPAEESAKPRWVHYGSSISHCLEADGPTGTWPAVAAAATGLDLTSLAFAGNAMLDPFVARTIRELPADFISLKIGINVVGSAGMRRRTFLPAVHGFLDTIREGHPDTPILVVSPVSCPMLEDTPGPCATDPATGRQQPIGDPAEADALGALTLGWVREALELLVRQRAGSDPALSYLDGRRLLGPDEADSLGDGLHPDAAAYHRMGARFADHLHTEYKALTGN
ncbi:GDSL-type esterase/lipase family protein [Streptacidiphilus sp. PAMC 29251]